MAEKRRSMVNEGTLVEMLRFHAASHGGQKQYARILKVSPQFLNDILNRRRGISDNFARKIGADRVTMFSIGKLP